MGAPSNQMSASIDPPSDASQQCCQVGRQTVFEPSLRPIDGKELVGPVRVAVAPGAIGDEAESGEPFASIPEGVPIEAGDVPFDAIQSPAGKAVAVGSQSKEQVHRNVRRLKLFEPALASEAMVDPSERARDTSEPFGFQDGQGLFQRHGVASHGEHAERY